MIEITNTEVFGWRAAIRGARNPMNSWDKSDSEFLPLMLDMHGRSTPRIGENDLKLLSSLSRAGNDHGKFLRMIHVQCDIKAPLYWWSECDTYKVGTTSNSCSKMHKLLYKPFELSDFSLDQVVGYKKCVEQFQPDFDEETEIWRKFDFWCDVSSQGRVRHGSRVLSNCLQSDGYRTVNIHGKVMKVHRLVATVFIDNPLGKKEVNHIDGNKQNNFVENLEWVTRSENQKHAVENCLQPKSVGGYKGKFSAEKRQEIKDLWDSGTSRRKIAEMYGVSHTCINDIVNDKYKYIDKTNLYEEVARPMVDMLNELRDAWILEEDEEKKKEIWYSIIQLLPSSYNQLRTWDGNYAVLKNIYHARKNHKLLEWHGFCLWIETLPYANELIICGEAGE